MEEDAYVMALKAQLKADQAMASLVEIKTEIRMLREENAAQHMEARKNIEKNLVLVHSRLDRVVWGGLSVAVAALGSLFYLFLQKL